MKDKEQGMWIGSEDFNDPQSLTENSEKEFFELPILDDVAKQDGDSMKNFAPSNRRDFLKHLGFGLGAAVIASSCEIPVRRALPYTKTPDQILPGVANYYASAYHNGGDFCPILVKTREGRPIKIEGNKLAPMSGGGTSARAQAYVLELYDRYRIRNPRSQSDEADLTWEELDQKVMDQLHAGSRVRILSHTILSPTLMKSIEDFKGAFPNTELVLYDPVSSSALLDAQGQATGKRIIPEYHFDKAETIVNFGADFLGTWISPVEYAADYVVGRSLNPKNPVQSRMYMLESGMSLTGSNADHRGLIKPSEKTGAIAYLYNAIAGAKGANRVSAPQSFSNSKVTTLLDSAAKDLIASGSNSLIVSDVNTLVGQLLVQKINELLGSVGHTISYGNHSLQRKGSDTDFLNFLEELETGSVDALIVLGHSNPAYDTPEARRFADAMDRVNLSISTSILPSETLAKCDYAAPQHHGLESWGDFHVKANELYLSQPTISPLFDSRAAEMSLLKWAGIKKEIETNESHYQYLKSRWQEEVFPTQNKYASFDSFWTYCIHNGYYKAEGEGESLTSSGVALNTKRIEINSIGDLELDFYETVNVGNGSLANNPWLQEMPDPVHRTVWDNFLTIPVTWDGERNLVGYKSLESGDLVEMSKGKSGMQMPVVQAFGQAKGTASLALGYGREVSGKAGTGVGINAYPLLHRDSDGYVQYYLEGASISEKVGHDKSLASVQYHHTMGLRGKEESSGKEINVDEKAVMTLAPGYQGGLTDRTIIRETNIDDLDEAVEDLTHEKEHSEELNEKTLYPGYEKGYNTGHKWGMNIDLSTCIGCGACQVACVAENNVPIVGKEEVNRHHEMTWLRIDRYYYGDVESPNVVYQPMLCQHCDNAPCENVCPVNATNHSKEGINQMVYNRCIGTRYCANNCPYKVRRFNWLDYTTADLFGVNENHPFGEKEDVPYYADNLTRMVLNPDVTVRSRGVMEKCTFCVQRIQEGKLTAKKEGRAVEDGEITPACASACPTGGIVFGDINDEKTEIAREMESPLSYKVLMEINTRPSITYKMKVVNRNKDISGGDV